MRRSRCAARVWSRSRRTARTRQIPLAGLTRAIHDKKGGQAAPFLRSMPPLEYTFARSYPRASQPDALGVVDVRANSSTCATLVHTVAMANKLPAPPTFPRSACLPPPGHLHSRAQGHEACDRRARGGCGADGDAQPPLPRGEGRLASARAWGHLASAANFLGLMQ